MDGPNAKESKEEGKIAVLGQTLAMTMRNKWFSLENSCVNSAKSGVIEGSPFRDKGVRDPNLGVTPVWWWTVRDLTPLLLSQLARFRAKRKSDDSRGGAVCRSSC